MASRRAMLWVMVLVFSSGQVSHCLKDSKIVLNDVSVEAGGTGGVGSPCLSDASCAAGLYCFACPAAGKLAPTCTRRTSTPTSTFPKTTSLPFNKYAWLTTHNSFAILGSAPQAGAPILTFFNQEDSVLQQLNNGVRGLMLDMYDFRGDIWLCHSFNGACFDFTAFRPAIQTLSEIKTFLDANPTEVVTIFIEDYVHAPNGITKLFTFAGLMHYWMPVKSMPALGKPWPTLGEMIQRNNRLLVFTQNSTKEASEGVAFQWRYTTENQYGDDGIRKGSCVARGGSPVLSDRNRSLILENYFPTNPNPLTACRDNSDGLFNMFPTCYAASGNRWSNYIAVDFYKMSTGGGPFRALDFLNGQMECNCQDITQSCLHVLPHSTVPRRNSSRRQSKLNALNGTGPHMLSTLNLVESRRMGICTRLNVL